MAAVANEVDLLLQPPGKQEIESQVYALIDVAFASYINSDTTPQTLQNHITETLESATSEKKQLDQQLDKSQEHIDGLLESARTTLTDLVQSCNKLRTDHGALEDDMIQHHDTLVTSAIPNNNTGQKPSLLETLESLLNKKAELDRARSYFTILKHAEDLSMETRRLSKNKLDQSSAPLIIQGYAALIDYTLSIDRTLYPNAFEHCCNICHGTWKHLFKTLPKGLHEALETLKWPSPFQSRLDPKSSPNEKALFDSFVLLLDIQKAFDKHQISSTSLAASPSTVTPLLPISALAEPLVLRFRYHFDGKRSTNRLDKPEWYFTHMSNIISEHARFLRQDIQSILNENGYGHISAFNDFISALLVPIERKIKYSVPHLLDNPSLLSHLIYSSIDFDNFLREECEYTTRDRSSPEDWPGIVDVILNNDEWFKKWKEAESDYFDSKYYEIISAPDAWQISKENDGGFCPTNSAVMIRDLFDQISERYRPLPLVKQWLPFVVDVQMPLLEAYLARVTSSVDAFETLSYGIVRAVSVPGTLGEGSGAKLTSGLAGLDRIVRAGVCARWMEQCCKNWSDDVTFLELLQVLHEQAANNEALKLKAAALLEATRTPDCTLFTATIESFRELATRIDNLIVRHVTKEISNILKEYLAKDWNYSLEQDNKNDEVAEVSRELFPALSLYSSAITIIGESFPRLSAIPLRRSVSKSIESFLFERLVHSKTFSETGGVQFAVDVKNGWSRAFQEASSKYSSTSVDPASDMPKLFDAATLLSLPSSDVQNLVNLIWNERVPLQETIDQVGVRKLKDRKEWQRILRRRPECWR